MPEKPELSKYHFIKEYIKNNPVNPIKDGSGYYTVCLGLLCLRCTMNSRCNIEHHYDPPRISPEDLSKLKKLYPEYFV